MRATMWAFVLLLAPLASAFLSPPTVVHTPPSFGEEVLLVLEEGQWDTTVWKVAESHGYIPLRVVRPEALLVWDDGWAVGMEHTFEEASPDAPYKADVGGGVRLGAHRVVFEPNLPSQTLHRLLFAMEARGLASDGSGLAVEGAWIPKVLVDLSSVEDVRDVLRLPGVLWVEPVLETKARNLQAAALMQNGDLLSHPLWDVGLNGSGVVLGVADSGVDADHACFRNATTEASPHATGQAGQAAVGLHDAHHRKILVLNTSIDDNDTPGHSDYRHGTHVVGSLACQDIESYRNNTAPGAGSSMAHAAKLVIQDIVSSEGWVPPDADALLYEASSHGAVIHSDSWGDDTTAYTARTGQFDAYARAMPWSLSFIAPGNSGEGVLEPANGRNVVSVGAHIKDTAPERWAGSAYGPTEAGTDGVFLLAPGSNLLSAAADGAWNTNNDNLRTSSGTSMSTPTAAGAAAVIQQLYEQGWIVGPYEHLNSVNGFELTPAWAAPSMPSTVLLGDGFTPSGALLRASLALASQPLNEEARHGGEGGVELHNYHDGWGMIQLERLINIDQLESGQHPTPHLWIHDSYRLVDGTVQEWMTEHGASRNDTLANQWGGEGAVGPFLSTGEVFSRTLRPVEGENVSIRLAFTARPEPALVDDLQLRVRLEDGRVLVPDRLMSDGRPVAFYGQTANFNNTTLFPSSNETTVGLDIPSTYLNGSQSFTLEVVARYIAPTGPDSGSVGVNGDRTGFAIVVSGVERDSTDLLDDDGDGINNANDLCPDVDASNDDSDGDGCLDDGDADGVPDIFDACPSVNANAADADADGCLDDGDGDGVTDDVDICDTPDTSWPVTIEGCYPVDRGPSLENVRVTPASNGTVRETLVVEWTVSDDDGDGAISEVRVVFETAPNTTLWSCVSTDPGPVHRCEWRMPDDLPPYYRLDESYRVEIRVQTTNQSPAASTDPVSVLAASGLTFPPSPTEGEAGADSRSSSGTVLITGLGLGAGAWLAHRRHRKQGRDEHELRGPFPSVEQRGPTS